MDYRIASDLHIEFWARDFEGPKEHVRYLDGTVLPHSDEDRNATLLLAGDLAPFGYWPLENFTAIMDRVMERFKKVLIVPGNHEYWGCYLDDTATEVVRQRAGKKNWLDVAKAAQNVHVFDKPGRVDDVFGATLWTDYGGGNPEHMNASRYYMLDGRRIKGFSPEVAMEEHLWHKERVTASRAPVVMTHMAPSYKSVHKRYRVGSSADINTSFYTDMEYLMHGKTAPGLWVHGHMHDAFDYVVGGTRIVCNPFGYHGRETGKNGYRPTLFINPFDKEED